MSSITSKASYEDYTDGRRRGGRLILILTYFFIIYLSQSTDAGDVIWSVGLCPAADPGHLFRRSPAGQCVKSYVHILYSHLDIQEIKFKFQLFSGSLSQLAFGLQKVEKIYLTGTADLSYLLSPTGCSSSVTVKGLSFFLQHVLKSHFVDQHGVYSEHGLEIYEIYF